MSEYYSDGRARRYNQRWRTYTEKTLAAAIAMIDFDALHHVELEHPPLVLDVACGTGTLLRQLLERVTGMEAYGVDGSADMLAQARSILKEQPHVRLERVKIGPGETAGLPFAPHTFELITCTNALHDLVEPVATLARLRQLLVPGGQLVLEDFARREPPFPWTAFEWLVRRIERSYVRAYTLAEAQALCARAGLHVVCQKAFPIDWLWHGWALDACVASS